MPRDEPPRARARLVRAPHHPSIYLPGFVDPGLWDTRLTPTGEAQARDLNTQLRARQSAGEPGVDLLLASPLRRALATAEIGFDGVACASRRVEPLASER